MANNQNKLIIAKSFVRQMRFFDLTDEEIFSLVSRALKDVPSMHITKMTKDEYVKSVQDVWLHKIAPERCIAKWSVSTKKTFGVMYVIYKAEYNNIDEFIKLVAKENSLSEANVRIQLLGNSAGGLYMTLYTIINYYMNDWWEDFLEEYNFQDLKLKKFSDFWHHMTMEQRLRVLEFTEENFRLDKV